MREPLAPGGRVISVPEASLADCEAVSHLTVEEQVYALTFPWLARGYYERLPILEGAYHVKVGKN